ncbi:YciI family protein [Amycolatopsis antarctica]|nr:YciI family protein [Amycolatopsis antarctica]
MILIYSNPETPWTGSESDKQTLRDLFVLRDELVESGELLGSEGLLEPDSAKTVRIREGLPVVTDGPFVESKEHLAGYFLVDCVSEERAVEIAARNPIAATWAVELRPVAEERVMRF